MAKRSGLKEWADVDLYVEDIGRATIERDRLEGEMNEKIADLKKYYGEQISLHDFRIADWADQLEAFCREHRSEMRPVKEGKGCTYRGVFGKVAFRACPPAIKFLTKNVEKVVAALRAKKLFNCIRSVEEPNKDVMLGLDDETLAAVHAKKKPSEQFEVKPDYVAIKNTVTEPAA